jgi:probable rRNA maturation factor
MLHIDVIVESGGWSAGLPDVETFVDRVARAAVGAARDVPGNAELSILLSDDANIRRLNRDYRGSDTATNVLAFGNDDPTNRPVGGPVGGPAGESMASARPTLLGDVVIAFETTAREAADQKKPLSHHVSHLLVHGVLHLLGYGHDEATAANDMEDLERAILAGLGIPDPYGERGPDERPLVTASGVAPNAQRL